MSWCIVYLDDVIVFSQTPEEHLKRLEAVFKKLKFAGLKLKPSKCTFFKKKSPTWGTSSQLRVLPQTHPKWK